MNLRHLRPERSYQKNSEDFIGWVNKLGLEKTWAGHVAHRLDEKFSLRKYSFLFIFFLALSFLATYDPDFNISGYRVGDLAPADFRSPMTLEVFDEDQTREKRLVAENSVPTVLDYDIQLYENLIDRLHQAFRRMRQIQSTTNSNQKLLNYQADFEADLGSISLAKETFQWLIQQKFRPAVEGVVIQNLSTLKNQRITDNIAELKYPRIIVRLLDRRGENHQEFLMNTESLTDVTEVKRKIAALGRFGIFSKGSDAVQMSDFIRALIIPNLTLNKTETENRHKLARESVTEVIVNIKKSQLIIPRGAPVQKIHMNILEEIKHLKTSRHQDFVALMIACFLLVLVAIFHTFLSRYNVKTSITTKDMISMGTLVLVIASLSKFWLFLSQTALMGRFPQIPTYFYSYLLPTTSAAMIVSLTIPHIEIVWMFSLFISIIAGIIHERDLFFMAMTFASSIYAARCVIGVKTRNGLYLAGLKTGLINVLFILCYTLISRPNPESLQSELMWNLPAGFLSGLFSGFIALTLIPIWETLFIYTTDVKLLELSNLNHPLLKDMIVKAPGTYHHSLVVGNMCEAAAESIGANPLLAKVCSYYHDIGKTNHALYFIENQKPGENKHDHINPAMSKTILVAHVKEGVELGLKHKLGKPIIDVIEQHHGTTLISYFFHKAKQTEDSEMHETSEDEYRYPGPKPLFREAALVMLADSIEAAARTLDEPTPARLGGIVHNIVQKKFLDGQLDDCQITLKDLTRIEEAFTKILLGIYHQRIDYPTAT